MKKIIAALIGSAAFAFPALAQAQAYPSKGIKIVVPFAVGGIADTFGRVVAQKLSESWGQTVIVENKTGAGGNIGAELVAKSPPDGYTLVVGNIGTHAVPLARAVAPNGFVYAFEPQRIVDDQPQFPIFTAKHRSKHCVAATITD